MKMAMNILILVSIAFVLNISVAYNSERVFKGSFCSQQMSNDSWGSFSHEWGIGSDRSSSGGSFSSERSTRSEELPRRCVICMSLCKPPAQACGDDVELGEVIEPFSCYFCTRSQGGLEGKMFVCGHIYAERSCVGSAPEDKPCPTCRMYSAIRKGDLFEVQTILILCAPKLHRIVFPHDRKHKSLINVAIDTGHFDIVMNIIFALLTRNLVVSAEKRISPQELAQIVLVACPQNDEFRWQALSFLMTGLAQYSGNDAANFICSILEKRATLQHLAVPFKELKNSVMSAFYALTTPSRHVLGDGNV